MRYISLFSGIEAASVAWEPLGMEPVCFCEIDQFPSAVLAERYPGVPNLGDITKVDWSEWRGAAEIVVGGSPCQSFSVAGDRTGLDGASGLMFEYVRAVRELMPRWLVWENVPGALSSAHGEDFGCLLRELDALGYGLAWRVLDAQFFGVAQRRERVFVVGSLGDGGAERACEVLFEPESLRWDTPSSREERQALAHGAGGGAASAGFSWHAGSVTRSIGYEPEQPPTLTATKEPAVICMTDTQPNTMVDEETCGTLTRRMYKDAPVVAFAANQRGEVRLQGGDGSVTGAIPASQSGKQVNGVSDGAVVRHLTPRECERLQGFPSDWTKVPYKGRPAEECPDTPRYKAIGNSMAVPVMRWIGRRIQMVEGDCREEESK